MNPKDIRHSTDPDLRGSYAARLSKAKRAQGPFYINAKQLGSDPNSDPNSFVGQRFALQRHVHPVDHLATGLVA
jgi:hypothetical protein